MALVKLLKAHAREVLQLENGQADEFLRLLRALREDLLGRLIGAVPEDQSFDAIRMRMVLAETEVGIEALERKAISGFSQGVDDSVDLAIDHVVGDLSALSRAVEGKSLGVTIDAAKILADPAQQLLVNQFGSSVKRYGLELLNGIRQRLFIGLRTGDPYGQVVREVAAQTGPLGRVGEEKADRLVRTETSQVYGAAQHSGLVQAERQVPGLKKIWLHIGSYRCPTCMPLHGTQRDIDGTWTIRQGSKSRKVMHAPAHPRCLCRITAMKPGWRNTLMGMGYLDQDPESAKSSPAAL